MKILFLFSALLFELSCGSGTNSTEQKTTQDPGRGMRVETKDYSGANVMKYANSITPAELKTYLYVVASDEMEGRMTGEPGQKKAAVYLRDQYKRIGVASAPGTDDYYQVIPGTYFGKNRKTSENVIAFIEGSEKPEEVLVISAHYDHVGIDEDGDVFNGADDDASGTVALLEIAEAFMKAKEDGYGPKRSILFLHATGEEIGLYGSLYYTENPLMPLANTVANLNIDMIGRIDPDKKSSPEYVYLIGSDKLSSELHTISEEANEKYIDLELDYIYNAEDDPNRFYYRSDHYNFAKNNIPVIFYFNGVHEDYHKVTDTADKINYNLLGKRTQLIFVTAWELANRNDRIEVDSNKE